MKPEVTVRPEGDLYVVTHDFGDVATYHRFATKRAAEVFVAGAGKRIAVSRPMKSSVKSIGANMKLTAKAASK